MVTNVYTTDESTDVVYLWLAVIGQLNPSQVAHPEKAAQLAVSLSDGTVHVIDLGRVEGEAIAPPKK